MQDFGKFQQYVIDKPELYDNYKTFFIRMKNASPEVRDAYNQIKNALMSYRSRLDKNHWLECELGQENEVFFANDVVAKFVIVAGELQIHIKIDAAKQDSRKAMFKISDEEMVVYKLKKPNAVQEVLKAIPKIMSGCGFIASENYIREDYAYYYKQSINEIADVLDRSQKEYEEHLGTSEDVPEEEEEEEEKKEEVPEVDDKNEPEEQISAVAANLVTPEGPTAEELEEEERQRKIQRHKNKSWREISSYGYDFVWLKYIEFYAVAILAGIGLSVAYQLKLFWTIILLVGMVCMMPPIVASFYRNKYETGRFDDVTSYIEQMLYSFRKNSKILVSLRDTASVFPEGNRMRDVIMKALYSTQNSTSGATIYSDALAIIEKAYPCRRVRTLHRYMMKVEGVGGNHDAGIEALLKDRRLWIERLDNYKQECKTVLLDIYIAIGFSVGLACMVVRMMATDLVDIPSNTLYQVTSVVFLLVCTLVIMLTIKSTALSLEDAENAVSSKKIIDKMNWLRNYDERAETKKNAKVSIIFAVFLVVSLIVKFIPAAIFCAIVIFYAIFVKKRLDKNSAVKVVSRAIEKEYPDWLLELALLLQTDNLHVAIEKTIDDAPLILKGDISALNDEIIRNPTSLDPFANFLCFLPLSQVHSSMKLLYSLSEFGQAKESVQLTELVDRNSALMDKAEKYRNDDRLSKTFILKFIPMGISAMKLLCDLVVLLMSYMGVLSGV